MIKKIIIFTLLLNASLNLVAIESRCFGTTDNGTLQGGVQLPSVGVNYQGYSLIARRAGRTFVHSKVYEIVVNTYKNLEVMVPNKVYKYAETGLKEGGVFKPHKTHQNGLSIDFMTPVMDQQGNSVHLPTNLLNKFGYNIEFDQRGHYDRYVIDYEAMAAHIVALHKTSVSKGYDLWRVIFDPKLQAPLYETSYGSYLAKHIQFSKQKSWVRHDEHYHVDFSIPCKIM